MLDDAGVTAILNHLHKLGGTVVSDLVFAFITGTAGSFDDLQCVGWRRVNPLAVLVDNLHIL